MAVDFGLAGEQAKADLLAPHLQAEDPHDVSGAGGVLRDVEGEGALAHAGAGGEHDQVRALQSSSARRSAASASGPASYPMEAISPAACMI